MTEYHHTHLLGRSHLFEPDSICECYDDIPGSIEKYECCLPYAMTACTIVSYSDMLQLLLFLALFIYGLIANYEWFRYQYTLIVASSFQLILLLHRTFYYGYRSNQGVSFGNYMYWKAMQATVPIVMGGCVLHFFQLNSIQRSKDFNVA